MVFCLKAAVVSAPLHCPGTVRSLYVNGCLCPSPLTDRLGTTLYLEAWGLCADREIKLMHSNMECLPKC
jgi:hypothetical protein